MREILFKGFHEDQRGKEKAFYNGEWHDGIWAEGFLYYEESYQGSINFAYIINDVVETNCGLDIISDYAVDPSTVCEYTGMTDKNGKKIWENDIVLTDEAGWIGRVIYNYGMFMCEDKRGGYSSYCLWDDFEVLGNYFDHPELLQSEDKQ